MAVNPWNDSLRNPRHQATEGSEIEVAVVRQTSGVELRISAELINLSRQGMQIRIGEQLVAGETVAARFRRQEAQPGFQQPATVLWVQPEDERWLVGCRFETEIKWEAMGELFANHVLKT